MNIGPARNTAYEIQKRTRQAALLRSRRGEKEYEPIKLVLNDRGRVEFTTNFMDIFRLVEVDTGNRRPSVDVVIVYCEKEDKVQLTFVEDEEGGEGLFAYIPKTERNMSVLASHYRHQLWMIDNDKIDAEVLEMSEKMEHTRDMEKELAQPDLTSMMNIRDPRKRDPENERLRILNDELKRERDEARKAAGLEKTPTDQAPVGTTVPTAAPEPAPQFAEPQVQDQPAVPPAQEVKTEPAPPAAPALPAEIDEDKIKEDAKTIVQNDTAFIAELKAESPKWWLSPKYRKRLGEVREELKANAVNA